MIELHKALIFIYIYWSCLSCITVPYYQAYRLSKSNVYPQTQMKCLANSLPLAQILYDNKCMTCIRCNSTCAILCPY